MHNTGGQGDGELGDRSGRTRGGGADGGAVGASATYGEIDGDIEPPILLCGACGVFICILWLRRDHTTHPAVCVCVLCGSACNANAIG